MSPNTSKVIIVCGTALGLSLIFLIRWRQKRELRRRQRRKSQGTLNIGGAISCPTFITHQIWIDNYDIHLSVILLQVSSVAILEALYRRLFTLRRKLERTII